MEYLRTPDFIIQEASSRRLSVARINLYLPGYLSRLVARELISTHEADQPYEYAGGHGGMAVFDIWALMHDRRAPIEPCIIDIGAQATIAIAKVSNREGFDA